MLVAGKQLVIPPERIERAILLIRGQKIMLGSDLASLYGVPVKAFNQAVGRNKERFPQDFMLRLTWEEARSLRSQFVTLDGRQNARSRSQSVISKRGRHLKYRPYAFTEQGVAMLSSVLKSHRAVQVNIEIMRAFVRLRQILATHADLARKLAALESKYDDQFRVVFEAIRELMAPPEPKRKRIGFHSEGEQ
jgi:hypothetical protein